MKRRFPLCVGSFSMMALVSSVPATGQTTKVAARLEVAEACVLAQDRFAELAQPSGEVEAGFLAPLLAAAVGSLVQSAVTGIANAIDSASSEHTFSASGVDGFTHGRIVRETAGPAPYSYRDQPRCAILVVPDDGTSSAARKDQVRLADIDRIAGIDEAVPTIVRPAFRKKIGDDFDLGTVPLVYAEIAVLPTKEGLQLTPLTVWYRKALPGASRSSALKAELHIALAAPGYSATGDAIGSVYAFSRFELPRMKPGVGSILKPASLETLNPIFHAGRAATEIDKVFPTSANAALAALATKKAEQAKAQAELDLAIATRQDKDSAVNRNAEEARRTALKAAADATLEAQKVVDGLTPLTDSNLQAQGRTNARVTFLVIRDENKFGKAVAAALKGQAEAAGKAVTTELTPTPDWAASDTAYVTADATLNSARVALNAAIAEGDRGKIAVAEAAVLVAKAKVNEAAVGADRPPPYPDIMD